MLSAVGQTNTNVGFQAGNSASPFDGLVVRHPTDA